jgi:hypothetical protein
MANDRFDDFSTQICIEELHDLEAVKCEVDHDLRKEEAA